MLSEDLSKLFLASLICPVDSSGKQLLRSCSSRLLEKSIFSKLKISFLLWIHGFKIHMFLKNVVIYQNYYGECVENTEKTSKADNHEVRFPINVLGQHVIQYFRPT